MARKMTHDAWTGFSKNGRDCVDKLRKRLTEALSGDVEAVHGVRVTSRRLTEPLQLLEKAPGGKPAKRARRDLKKVRNAFCGVRDMDVLAESLTETDFQHRPEVLARLREDVAAERKEALSKAKDQYAAVDHRALLANIKKLFAASRHLEQIDGSAVETMLNSRIEAVLAADPRRDPRADMHEARIAVKRLRYCADLAEAMQLPARERLVATLKEFQKLLGEWNDHTVAAAWLAGVARKRENLARCMDYSAELLEYAATRARRGHELRCIVGDRWPELERAMRGEEAQPTMPRLAVGE